MEIQSNFNASGLTGRIASRQAAPAAAETAWLSFQESQALERSLETAPETRAEEVARARQLIAHADYPPQVMIEKISLLLAVQMDSGEE